MARKATLAGIIVGVGAAVIILAAIYSYQRIEVLNTDIEITDITFSVSGAVEGLARFLATGNYLELFSAVERIDLHISSDIQNGGFLPLTIPTMPYSIYVNDVPVGDGQINESLFIEGGQIERLSVSHSLPGTSLEPALNSIIDRGGMMTVKVDFTPQIRWGGFESPQLLVIQKDFDLVEEIRNRLT